MHRMPTSPLSGQPAGGTVRLVADMVAQWATLIGAALLPIFILPFSWAIVGQAKVLLLGVVVIIALIAWVVARFAEGSVSIPKNILLLSVSLLPVAYTLSALFSGASTNSFVGGSAEQDTVVVVCILYTFFILSALQFRNSPRALVRPMRAFLVGAFLLVVFQLLRLAFPAWLTLGGALQGSASSILGSWHDLAILAGFFFFIACAFDSTMASSGYLWRWLLRIVGFGSFILLIIVNTVDVWYTLAIFAVLFGLYRLYIGYVAEGMSSPRAILTKAAPWAALAIISVALGLWGSAIYTHLPASLQITQLEVRPSWQGTFAIGEKVLSGKNGFIFGSGPNTFTQEWSLFKPAGVNATAFWNTNFAQGVGIIPTAFVTVGILGIIAWILPCLGLLWSIVKLVRDRRTGVIAMRSHTAAMLFSALYLMAFLVMYVPGIGVVALAFLFLGMLVAAETAGNTSAMVRFPLRGYTWKHIAGSLVLLVLSFLLVFASVTALRATISDLYLGRAVADYNASPDIGHAATLVGDALAIFPQNDNAQRAAVELGFAKLSELTATGKTDDAARAQLQATLSDTIQHGLAAVSINGNDYLNWLELAGLYQNLAGEGVQGAFQNAENAYEKAITEDPADPLPLAELAQLEMAQGNTDVALQALNKAISLKQDFPAAYYFRSQIEASKGNFAAAASDASAATTLVPTDPTGWYNLGTIYFAAAAYQDAATALEHAISLQQNYANAMYVLALSYAKLGRQQDALTLMQQVEALNPGNADVGKAVTQLESATSTTSHVPAAH